MKKRFAQSANQTHNDADGYITQWCGTVIARSHSMIQKVKEIAEHQNDNELTTVSIRGREGTGKTTLAITIAHLLHQHFDKFGKKTLVEGDDYGNKHIRASQRGYVVKVLSRDDLMKFSEVLSELPKQNRILIFDDLSFIKGNIDNIKQQVSQVRHTEGGIDLKTVLFFNFHYSKGFDKFLRDTHFIIQTSGGTEEIKNIGEILGGGKRSNSLAAKFVNIYIKFNKQKKISIPMSRPGTVPSRVITYDYSRPFRLALFYDGMSPRFMVYPSAGQSGSSDPLGVQKCQICNQVQKLDINLDSVNEWLVDRFGKAVMGIAMKNMSVIRYGHDALYTKANVALECIRRLEKNGVINYVDLLESYTKTDRQNIKKYMRRGTMVPKSTRESFFLKFLHDGLKSMSDQSLKQSDIKGTEITP